MYSPSNASGFLLLTLPNCTVDSPSLPPKTGLLSLQCVTLDLNPSDDGDPQHEAPASSSSNNNNSTNFLAKERDIWLVLKLDSFEMVISPTQRINHSRSESTYIFLPERPGVEFTRVVVPPDPQNPSSTQDLETLEVILSQYGVLHDVDAEIAQKGVIAGADHPPPPYTAPRPAASASASTINDKSAGRIADNGAMSDFRGHLVLMDKDSGEIMGTLDEKVKLREDETLSVPTQGREKDPVVVELPSEEEEALGKDVAYVHAADAQDQDVLMRTAGLISNGILFLSSALSSGLTSLANFYIAHSTPTTKPITFSPRTKTNVKRIHSISGTAVEVSSRTTNAIFKLVDGTLNRLTGANTPNNTAPGARQRAASPPRAPPLPPRKDKDKSEISKEPSNLPPPPALPPRSYSPGPGSSAPPTLPPRKPRLLNRILASTDIILTALEQSATQLIESGTDAVSRGIGHKYGAPAGDMSRLAGNTVRNVSLVYVDVRGVGRRALLKRAGKAVVKAQFAGRDIVFLNSTENAAQGAHAPVNTVNPASTKDKQPVPKN